MKNKIFVFVLMYSLLMNVNADYSTGTGCYTWNTQILLTNSSTNIKGAYADFYAQICPNQRINNTYINCSAGFDGAFEIDIINTTSSAFVVKAPGNAFGFAFAEFNDTSLDPYGANIYIYDYPPLGSCTGSGTYINSSTQRLWTCNKYVPAWCDNRIHQTSNSYGALLMYYDLNTDYSLFFETDNYTQDTYKSGLWIRDFYNNFTLYNDTPPTSTNFSNIGNFCFNVTDSDNKPIGSYGLTVTSIGFNSYSLTNLDGLSYFNLTFNDINSNLISYTVKGSKSPIYSIQTFYDNRQSISIYYDQLLNSNGCNHLIALNYTGTTTTTSTTSTTLPAGFNYTIIVKDIVNNVNAPYFKFDLECPDYTRTITYRNGTQSSFLSSYADMSCDAVNSYSNINNFTLDNDGLSYIRVTYDLQDGVNNIRVRPKSSTYNQSENSTDYLDVGGYIKSGTVFLNDAQADLYINGIKINYIPYSTGGNGYFKFNDIEKGSNVKIVVYKEGYNSDSTTFNNIQTDLLTYFNFTLFYSGGTDENGSNSGDNPPNTKNTKNLMVCVVDKDTGNRIYGSTVTLSGDGTELPSIMGNNVDCVEYEDILQDYCYYIKVEKTLYTTYNGRQTVCNSEYETVRLQLESHNPNNLCSVYGKCYIQNGTNKQYVPVSDIIITRSDGFTKNGVCDSNGDYNIINLECGKSYSIKGSYLDYSYSGSFLTTTANEEGATQKDIVFSYGLTEHQKSLINTLWDYLWFGFYILLAIFFLPIGIIVLFLVMIFFKVLDETFK